MKSEQINELAAALVKAQAEIKPAIKDASNPFYKSKYADLHSTWDACREALHKNGLTVVQTVESGHLVTTLLHTSGQWIDGSCPLINSKNDMQGLGSAMSYARRYGLAAIVGVVTEDDDANAADQKTETKSDYKAPKPIALAPQAKASDDYVIPLKKFAGKRLSEVPSFELLNYMDWIKREGITKPDYLEFISQVENHLKTSAKAK